MLTVQPGGTEMAERWYESDPAMRFKIASPFNAETGNKDLAVGYFEVEPGNPRTRGGKPRSARRASPTR